MAESNKGKVVKVERIKVAPDEADWTRRIEGMLAAIKNDKPVKSENDDEGNVTMTVYESSVQEKQQ